MKKLLCMIIALLAVLSMYGCTKTEDASAKFTSAKSKTDALSSFEAEMKVDFNVCDNGGDKAENNSTVHIKLDRSDKSAPVYLSKYSFKQGDNSSESSIYYENGTEYECSTIGEKYYTEVDPGSVADSFSNISIDIPQAAFAKSQTSSDSDGAQHIEAITEPSEAEQVLRDFASSVTSQYTPKDGSDDFELKFSDLKLGFDTDPNGYFTEIAISYKLDFEHSRGTTAADFDITLSYIKPGEQVSVERPSDLSEYTPIPDSSENAADTSSSLTEEQQYELTNEVFTLFDDDHNKVPDYDMRYEQLCKKYDKASVDSIVEMIEALKKLSN